MDYLEINKKLWEERTPIHIDSDFYDVDGFIKGKSSLNPIEIDLLGSVQNKSILHLQCHFGLDSLSLARCGARVTGIDFSANAIEKARALNKQLNCDVTFIESDIYSADQKLDEKFDIVFASYGVVGWLPDLARWATIVSSFLKPGGEFVFIEFHPVVWIFSDDFRKIEYNYSDAEPIIEEIEGTYTDKGADIKNKSVTWNHGLENVLGSILDSGLVLSAFREFNYSPYNCFKNTVKIGDGRYQINGLENKIPLVYSLKAKKHGIE